MKKISKAIILVLIILMTSTIPISYAINTENEKSNFLELDKQEISVGDTLKLTIDWNEAKWEKIKFTLSSNWNINDIYLDNEEEIDMETENQEIIIEIDKTKSSLKKTILYYPISQEIEEGTSIILQGKIENLEQNEESQTEENVLIIEKTVKIVANQNLENNKQEDKNNNIEPSISEEKIQSNNKQDIVSQLQQRENQTNQQTVTIKQAESINYNSGNIQTEETVTYKGSDNNYLSDLAINGYTLNKEFNKESSTYFATVSEETDSVEVITNVEDSNTTVCVAGADNLKKGENKILISVTAENGNVRNYRIYVTKG